MKHLIYLLMSLVCSLSLHGQMELIAKVNGGPTDTISAGIPVMIHVQLANIKEEHTLVNNMAIQENLDYLKELLDQDSMDQKSYDEEYARLSDALVDLKGEAVVPTHLTGTISLFVDEVELDTSKWEVCYAEGSDELIAISGNVRLSWFLGIPSQTTQEWSSGMHEISIHMDSFISKSLKVWLDQRSANEDMLIGAGYYEVDCGDPMEAQRIAESILTTNPGSIEAKIILADAYVGQAEEIKALLLYKESLQMFYEQFPHSPEPPEYLLQQIDKLERRK